MASRERVTATLSRRSSPPLLRGAEAHAVPTGLLIQSVGHAENDSIAFITLNVFQILHEEWLGTILAEERLKEWTVLSQFHQFVQHGELLFLVERNDS